MEYMKTILVTEDHKETNQTLCRLLRLAGYRTISAFDGETALTLLPAERPDLMILDMMMPGMDGIEVLRLVRSNPLTATMPVIAYTGIADLEFREHARKEGVTDFCVKGSIDFEQLTALIAKYA
jgi:CheY-like chemotaxis protein